MGVVNVQLTQLCILGFPMKPESGKPFCSVISINNTTEDYIK